MLGHRVDSPDSQIPGARRTPEYYYERTLGNGKLPSLRFEGSALTAGRAGGTK
jgi:hypothetical protein